MKEIKANVRIVIILVCVGNHGDCDSTVDIKKKINKCQTEFWTAVNKDKQWCHIKCTVYLFSFLFSSRGNLTVHQSEGKPPTGPLQEFLWLILFYWKKKKKNRKKICSFLPYTCTLTASSWNYFLTCTALKNMFVHMHILCHRSRGADGHGPEPKTKRKRVFFSCMKGTLDCTIARIKSSGITKWLSLGANLRCWTQRSLFHIIRLINLLILKKKIWHQQDGECWAFHDLFWRESKEPTSVINLFGNVVSHFSSFSVKSQLSSVTQTSTTALWQKLQKVNIPNTHTHAQNQLQCSERNELSGWR